MGAAARAIGSGDDGGDIVAGIEEGAQARNGELGRSEEDDAHQPPAFDSSGDGMPGECLAAVVLLPAGDQDLALHRLEVVDEQHAVEMVDFVLHRASDQAGRRRDGTPCRLRRALRGRSGSGRVTSAYASGMERQPSSLASLPAGSTTRGLIIAKVCPSALITATRRATPTWLAARPTPFAAAMVSNRSSTSARSSSSTVGDLLGALPQHRRASTGECCGQPSDRRPGGLWSPTRTIRPRSTTSVEPPLSMVSRASLTSRTLPTMPPAVTTVVALLDGRASLRPSCGPGALRPDEQEVDHRDRCSDQLDDQNRVGPSALRLPLAK